jgi:hypothetical protein
MKRQFPDYNRTPPSRGHSPMLYQKTFKSITNSQNITPEKSHRRNKSSINLYNLSTEDKHCQKCKSFDKYAKPGGFSNLYNHNKGSIQQELL